MVGVVPLVVDSKRYQRPCPAVRRHVPRGGALAVEDGGLEALQGGGVGAGG